MRHPHTRLLGALAAVLLLASVPGFSPSPLAAAPGACPVASGQDPRSHCCFVHRSYAGVCEIEPSKDETCDSILQYLNDPRSQGKTYCNNTSLRGDWRRVPCDTKMRQD